MQNNHNELWNIVDLAQTDYLGSWEEFERTYSKPIKYGRCVFLLIVPGLPCLRMITQSYVCSFIDIL